MAPSPTDKGEGGGEEGEEEEGGGRTPPPAPPTVGVAADMELALVLCVTMEEEEEALVELAPEPDSSLWYTNTNCDGYLIRTPPNMTSTAAGRPGDVSRENLCG